MTPFRSHHLIQFLETYEGAIDFALSQYFRRHKAIGSKDRVAISEALYFMIRWQRAIDSQISNPITWKKRVEAISNFNKEDWIKRNDIKEALKASFPDELFQVLKNTFGSKAFEVALTLNEAAPTFIRVNPLKSTLEEMIEILKPFDPQKGNAPHSIKLKKRGTFFQLDAFKAGKFEMQDEASQEVALKVKAKPGDRVLDFCSGSGGKTLAFAPQLEGQGQIYLHDIRKGVLFEAKKRLKRAGIQNAQIIHLSEETKLKKLKGFFDWVLVDAPCSGSGTYRRNPDMKEKFTLESLNNLVATQKAIFAEALAYLKPKGTIVYATCSLFNEENQDQVEYFIKTHNLQRVEDDFQSIPSPGEKDGLFAAVLKRA